MGFHFVENAKVKYDWSFILFKMLGSYNDKNGKMLGQAFP